MPVGKTGNMDNIHRPPSKIPVPSKAHAPVGGTVSDLQGTANQSGRTKVRRHEPEVPQTELEKLDSLRSKLEQSVDAFIKARKELEEIISAEGSSEQGHTLTGSPTGLRTELRRHRELTSKLKSSSKGNKNPKHSS